MCEIEVKNAVLINLVVFILRLDLDIIGAQRIA